MSKGANGSETAKTEKAASGSEAGRAEKAVDGSEARKTSAEAKAAKPSAPTSEAEKVKPRKNRNLLILGVLSVAIAVATTAVSLVIYHKSGDIYLDRSRPGFLPDEQELERDDNKPEDYKMTDSGDLDYGKLDEYMQHYMEQLNELDELAEPFSATPLSDESLGIPEE